MANLKGLKRLFSRGERGAKGIAGLSVETDSTPEFIRRRAAQSYQRRAMTEVKNTSPMTALEANTARAHNEALNGSAIKPLGSTGEFKTRSIEGNGSHWQGKRNPVLLHQNAAENNAERLTVETGQASDIGPRPSNYRGQNLKYSGTKPAGPQAYNGQELHNFNPTVAGPEKYNGQPLKQIPKSNIVNEGAADEFNKKWNDKETGFWDKTGMVGKGFAGTYKASLEAEGGKATFGGIARATGANMMVGAVAGGAAGGVISAAQGGDFWDGAKEGAFNGAVGWAGAHAVRRGVGAKTFMGKEGVWNSMSDFNKSGAFAKDGISSSAKTLINARQMAGMSSAVTKGAVK